MIETIVKLLGLLALLRILLPEIRKVIKEARLLILEIIKFTSDLTKAIKEHFRKSSYRF